MPEPHPRKRKLLRGFDRKRKHWKTVLAERFGASEADSIFEEARAAFEASIDDLPYRTHSDPMADQVFGAAEYLALYRVLRGRGLGLEEIGAFADPLTPGPLGNLPAWLQPLVGRVFFKLGLPRLRRAGRKSQERNDPDAFIYDVVPEPNGKTVGLDMKSCAICRFAAKHDALEAVPYLCATDDPTFADMGVTLRRTGTIALGAHRCDFRFQLGGAPNALRDQYDLATRRPLESRPAAGTRAATSD